MFILQFILYESLIRTTPSAMIFSSSTKTIIGIMLIKFASGFVSDWGVISLYILSYYHYHDSLIKITSSTNSLAMIILLLPVIICLVVSTKVADRIGYVQLIKISSVMYFVFPLVSFFNFSLIVFLLCNMIIPTCSFTLSLIPLFNCMYSYYGDNKNFVTGLVIGSFSLGAIVWNIVATMWINPDNLIPDIKSDETELMFFGREVADRVPRATNIIYLVSGILVMVGALLVEKNDGGEVGG
jgi:MFS family permease